jgi:tRNA pseudouridine55 synthase
MDTPWLVDKPSGATPLEALGLLRSARPELALQKLSYAGRLDPMATGLLVVLHGDLLALQEQFWHLKKAYEAEVVLGVSSDTFDLLGIATGVAHAQVPVERVLAEAQSLVGRSVRSVPAYSSIVHEGKPLFMHARAGVLPAALPVRRMDVSEVVVAEVGTVSSDALLAQVGALVGRVSGDFRQDAIAARWNAVLTERSRASWPLVRMRIDCSAGTYIRALAHELGQRLGTGGVLASLRRVRVGPWSVDDDAVIRFA